MNKFWFALSQFSSEINQEGLRVKLSDFNSIYYAKIIIIIVILIVVLGEPRWGYGRVLAK